MVKKKNNIIIWHRFQINNNNIGRRSYIIIDRSIGIDINLRFNTSKNYYQIMKEKKNIGGGNNFTMASISFDFLEEK